MNDKIFDDVSVNPHIARKLGIAETYYLSILTKFYTEENMLNEDFFELVEKHFFIPKVEQDILLIKLINNKGLIFIGDNPLPSINYDLQCDLLGMKYDK